MIIQDKKTISLLVNLSIASARLRSLTIKEPKKDYSMRPQLHLMLSGNQGSNKSTILYEVAHHFKTYPYNDITDAGLIGSIDKNTRQFTEGASWTCRNGIMVLDEFEFLDGHFRPKPILNKLLSLTEGEQYFKKKVAIDGVIQPKKDGDLFLKVEHGEMQIKTNFSLMIGTMDALNFHTDKLKALKSRCLPIRWQPDFDLILSIAHGEPVFTYHDLLDGWTKQDKKITISEKDYLKILDFILLRCKNEGMFLRILGDCCRTFAILKKHDELVYELIIKIKMGWKEFPSISQS